MANNSSIISGGWTTVLPIHASSSSAHLKNKQSETANKIEKEKKKAKQRKRLREQQIRNERDRLLELLQQAENAPNKEEVYKLQREVSKTQARFRTPKQQFETVRTQEDMRILVSAGRRGGSKANRENPATSDYQPWSSNLDESLVELDNMLSVHSARIDNDFPTNQELNANPLGFSVEELQSAVPQRMTRGVMEQRLNNVQEHRILLEEMETDLRPKVEEAKHRLKLLESIQQKIIRTKQTADEIAHGMQVIQQENWLVDQKMTDQGT